MPLLRWAPARHQEQKIGGRQKGACAPPSPDPLARPCPPSLRKREGAPGNSPMAIAKYDDDENTTLHKPIIGLHCSCQLPDSGLDTASKWRGRAAKRRRAAKMNILLTRR